jgi:hypothetical protein
MVGDKKNNESESESEHKSIWRAIETLQKRVRDLETHLMSLDHGNEGGNDIRDGGWFD